MYKHPNTHFSKQIHTEAYKGGLNLKNPKLYKIAVLFSSAERSDARLLYKTIYFVSAGGARKWQSLSGSFGERKPARAIIKRRSEGGGKGGSHLSAPPSKWRGGRVGKYGRGARGAHRAPRAPAGAADGNGQERRADSARGAAARPEAVAAAPQNRTKGIAFLCDFARALCAKPHKKRLLCDFGGLDGGAVYPRICAARLLDI